MSDNSKLAARKSRRGCRRNQKGGLSSGYAVGGPVVPGLPIGNSSIIIPDSGCRATTPDYAITPPAAKGLPGMSGGAYTFNLTNPVVGNGAALSMGGYPEVQRLACEGTVNNPLNPPPHTPSTAPAGAVSQWDMVKASLGGLQTGGFAPLSAENGSPYLTAPTAGYANVPSKWLDSVGAPVQLQPPYDARTPNPACMKTGGGKKVGGGCGCNGPKVGGKRKARKSRKGTKSRKSRKSRKGTKGRKSRRN